MASNRAWKAGETYRLDFTTHSATGADVAADSLPTVKVFREGGADDAAAWSGSVALVSGSAAGHYRYTGVIPAAYANGDQVVVVVTVVVGGITSSVIADEFRIEDVDALRVDEALRIILASHAGKASIGAGGSIAFRDQADSTDRLVLAVDSNGVRSSTTLDAT